MGPGANFREPIVLGIDENVARWGEGDCNAPYFIFSRRAKHVIAEQVLQNRVIAEIGTKRGLNVQFRPTVQPRSFDEPEKRSIDLALILASRFCVGLRNLDSEMFGDESNRVAFAEPFVGHNHVSERDSPLRWRCCIKILSQDRSEGRPSEDKVRNAVEDS